MKKNDVSYLNEDGTKKFNYRVALLAVNDNKILLQKSEKDSYYSLIGGRVQLFEDSEQAIKREVEEETGILLNSSEIKLVNIVENFFTFNKTAVCCKHNKQRQMHLKANCFNTCR